LRDGPTERSRARGVPRQCQTHSLRLDRSKRRLSPNPISSGTFCRELVVMAGWRCRPPIAPDKRVHCTSPPEAEHASVPHQGRFRHPSAKKDTISRTQGAFHRQISPIEACMRSLSGCRQPEKGHKLAPFRSSCKPPPLTKGRSTKTRPCPVRWHECQTNHKDRSASADFCVQNRSAAIRFVVGLGHLSTP
jgi:hypothetical protein